MQAKYYKFFKKIVVFFILVFMAYLSIFLYFYYKRYDDATLLLAQAINHEKECFEDTLKKEKFKNEIELKDKFNKEIEKLYSLCSTAIKDKINNDACQIQYDFSFNVFDKPQEIYIFYNFDKDGKEFYKSIARTRNDGSKVWKTGGEYVYWHYIFGFYDAKGYMFNQGVYKNNYEDNDKISLIKDEQ